MASALFDKLEQEKIIAIIRGIDEKTGDQTAQALMDGGIVFMEVTMNTGGVLQMISRFREKFGHKLAIGAGTVINVEMAKEAVAAGAEYLISPNLDEEVIRFAVDKGIEVWPGTMTPTEIVRAYQLGASAVKVFPMGALGINYLKEIRAPLDHIPMIATGGVNLETIDQYFAAGAIAVGLGGNLVDKALVRDGRFDDLRQRAQAFVAKAKGVQLI